MTLFFPLFFSFSSRNIVSILIFPFCDIMFFTSISMHHANYIVSILILSFCNIMFFTSILCIMQIT